MVLRLDSFRESSLLVFSRRRWSQQSVLHLFLLVLPVTLPSTSGRCIRIASIRKLIVCTSSFPLTKRSSPRSFYGPMFSIQDPVNGGSTYAKQRGNLSGGESFRLHCHHLLNLATRHDRATIGLSLGLTISLDLIGHVIRVGSIDQVATIDT